ncbi:MAG: nucleotidyltransferase domain-containing protein [Candidatus Omnitrophota bacterium]
MDISKIFNSKTRKELFRLYFTNPENAYYLRELERVLNIPISMIRQELLRLEKEGMFTFYKRGNLAYFSLNKAYPLFDELKSIVFKTIGVKGLITQQLEKIKGVKVAFIYGSFAKNEERAISDIDLFVIGNINENLLSRELARMEKTLKREINYSLYTKDEFIEKKKNKDSFILELLENKKIFLIGNRSDL